MASQSLYRKWRSQTFNDLVGQESIIRTLKNALNSDKLAHAYLFTGPRGTGKTSTARLLAKTINCTNSKDGEPCNECQQCREITAGNSFNVIEIDAASNRGIDSIRDLREKIMMPPSTGKYKVYVLDEAHMLTTEAFNALLKTLEEPPDYAIFVMATTDVHKMLPTVLSRCQRFDFTRITTRQIVSHLLYIAEQEQVKLERSAAELLARAAAGGMRDALSLLDQAIAYSGSDVALSQVQQMLGVADPRAISNLIGAVAAQDGAAGLHMINQLSDSGADLRQVNAQLIEFWRGLLLAKAGANINEILDSTEDEVNELNRLAREFSLEELAASARIFAQNDLMQKNIGTPQLGLELAFLECLEIHRRGPSASFQPVNGSTPQVSQVAQPRATYQTQTPPPQPPAVRQEQRPAQAPQMPVNSRPAPEAPVDVSPVVIEEISQPERFGGTAQELEASEASREAAYQEPTIVVEESVEAYAEPLGQTQQLTFSVEQIKEHWTQIKKRVRAIERSSKTAGTLNDYVVMGVEAAGSALVVILQAQHDFSYTFINGSDRHKFIEEALATEFMDQGITFQVRLMAPGKVLPTVQQQAPINLASQAPTLAKPQARREPRPAAPPVQVSPPAQPREQAPAMPPPSPVRQIPQTPRLPEPPSPTPREQSHSAPLLARTEHLSENRSTES
ncbi:MAG TPA: DNA polymerase III subunit gamma/tau, partial [Ktedonobacteraceae bacterium]|nr:DNA polymerase III subunit gamma/tau [Ktedonobacteraceae bacterium]